MRRLVLFDIDGTLVTDGGAARQAFGAALATVYRYTGDLAPFDFSGRTDPEIAFMVLRAAGIPDDAIASRLPDLWDAYLQGLGRAIETGADVRALPGIADLLSELARRPDIVLALLTGNLEQGARLKLTPPSLNVFFPFGAFGSDSHIRSELPPVAVRRASAHTGRTFRDREIVIIGDSVHDVRCGVPHGATTIAIASGKTPAATLRAENPTHFFEDARETEALLEAITE